MKTFAFFVFASLPAFAQISLDERVQALLPRKEESVWLSIPWITNLQAARRESVASGKPILVWIMDGHVLGCT